MAVLKKVLKVAVIAFGALVALGAVLDLLGVSDGDTVAARDFASVDEACAGFWGALQEVVYTPHPDHVASPLFEAVAKGAVKVDVALGSAIHAMADGSPAETSDNGLVAFRRCDVLGWSAPEDELAELMDHISRPIPPP